MLNTAPRFAEPDYLADEFIDFTDFQDVYIAEVVEIDIGAALICIGRIEVPLVGDGNGDLSVMSAIKVSAFDGKNFVFRFDPDGTFLMPEDIDGTELTEDDRLAHNLIHAAVSLWLRQEWPAIEKWAVEELTL